MFDAYLDASRIEITLQRVDAASLLWRLHLLGADVGDRWQALVAGWPLDAATAGRSVFNDAHATLALIGAGAMARARDWVALSIDSAERRPGWNRDVSRELGAPLMRGLLAFGDGRHGDAAAAIAPLRDRLARIGGSHAQRDVIEQTLLAAARAAADRGAGRALLAAPTSKAACGASAPTTRGPKGAERANAAHTHGAARPSCREGALHRRPREHAVEPGLDVRQRARRSREAARPAAEHEGVGIDGAEARAPSSHGPPWRASSASIWSSIAPILVSACALTCATAPASSAQRSG